MPFITPLFITTPPFNRCSNRLGPTTPIKMLENLPFCHFYLFLILLLTLFINRSDSSRGLTISMILSIASYDIIIVVILDPKICFYILASRVDAAVVSLNGIKTLLAYVLRATFIKGYPDFSNGPSSLPRDPRKPTILDS